MIRLFLRGFAIVSFTAANVRAISSDSYGGAFFTGFAISAIWWSNAGRASDRRGWKPGLAYASGAACGTVFGMWIGGMLR